MLNIKWTYNNQNGIRFFTNGIYKVVKYGQSYYAYYKPKGWKNWGMSCEYQNNNSQNSQTYKSFKDAIKACERHYLKEAH